MTRKRRAARAPLESRLIHGTPGVPPHLSPAEWCEITETLDGILRIEYPSPFTNLELRCPKEAWLVLDLAHARATVAGTPSLFLTIERILTALTRLLVHAETLRAWTDPYEVFWTRVLTSDMCRNRLELEHDPWLRRGFIRFVKARGTHVAFHWQGRPLEPNHVIRPLHKCLETTIHVTRGCHVPLRVALRFEGCQITSKALVSIFSLLTAPMSPIDTRKAMLFETITLRVLSLSCNTLHAHMLRDLAHHLQYPATRRIDGLKLDSTLPAQPHQTSSHSAAFNELLSTVVALRHVPNDQPDCGLSLSLEDWTVYRVGHVEALSTALTHATRPLRGLSLACWHLPEAAALNRFARLLLTALPTATSDFDLNISCIRGTGGIDDVEFALQDARAPLLEAALPRAREALDVGRRVRIRLSCFCYVSTDEEQTSRVEWEVSTSRFYDVRQITEDQHIEISTTPRVGNGDDNNNVLTGWTRWWDLVNIRIDDSYELRSAPSGLIADRCKRKAQSHTGEGRVVVELASVTGGELTRLSMRHNRWNSQQCVYWCPYLQEFNADGDLAPFYDDGMFWSDDVDLVVGQSLQVIQAACCNINNATLRKFIQFPKVHSLRLAGSRIDVHGLEALRDKLETSPVLEYADLRHADFNSTNEAHAVILANINRLLEIERTGPEACRALWVVLCQLETKHQWGLSGDVFATILSFLETDEKRVVVW